MMKKANALKSQGGFALVSVLIAVSLLLILGTALAMVTMGNLRQAYQLRGTNKAFYLSDGAVEESLSELNDMVRKAEIKANKAITEAYNFKEENIFKALEAGSLKDTFLEEEQWVAFIKKLNLDETEGTLTQERATLYLEMGLRCEFLKSYYQHLLGLNGVETEDKLAYTLIKKDGDYQGIWNESAENPQKVWIESCLGFKNITQNALKTTFKEKLTKLDIRDYVENVSGYKENTSKEAINAVSIESKFSKENGIEITLKTDGRFNSYKRAVELKVALLEPKYAYVIKSTQTSENIVHNVLMDYAVTAGKNIIVSGGQTNISGNVYGYGSFLKPEKNSETTGGVALGFHNATDRYTDISKALKNQLSGTGHLSVTNGDLMTRGDLLLYDNSTLSVSGDLGVGELKHLHGNTIRGSANVAVGKNAYILEDLEERSQTAFSMEVGSEKSGTGALYLILSSYGNSKKASDKAGSIIIEEANSQNFALDVDRLFVSGVAFSGLFRQVALLGGGTVKRHFMTGESVNIENRFMDFYKPSSEYTEPLGPFNVARYGVGNPDEGPYLVDKFNGVGTDDVAFKSQVFMNNARQGTGINAENDITSQGIPEKYKKQVRIRSIKSNSDLSKNYGLGVLLGTGDDNKGKLFNPEYSMEFAKYKSMLQDEVLSTLGEDVDRRMNLLNTRDFYNEENRVYKFANTEGASIEILEKDGGNSRLSQLVDFSKNVTKLDSPYNIQIVNGNKNKPVYINLPNSLNPSNGLTVSGTDLKGVILTKGDVYIYAKSGQTLSFEGLIAAEGEVVFYGDGTKNIVSSEEVITSQAASYDSIKNALYGDKGRRIINLLGGKSGASGMTAIQKGFNMSEIEKQMGTSEIYSITEFKAPVILTIPGGREINVTVQAPPVLEGMQKKKDLKGYKILSWREIRE